MSDRSKLQVRFWGLSINADGVVAIIAALLIVTLVLTCFAVLAAYRL